MGAAVLGLPAHLVGDVGAGLAAAVFVERGEDAVHTLTGVAIRSVAKIKGDPAFADRP